MITVGLVAQVDLPVAGLAALGREQLDEPRAAAARRPRQLAAARLLLELRSTTSAVVRAPTSAMISASSRRSQVSSSSVVEERRLDLGAQRLARLGQVLAQAAEEAAARSGCGVRRRSAGARPAPVAGEEEFAPVARHAAARRYRSDRRSRAHDDALRRAADLRPRARGRAARERTIAAMVAEVSDALRRRGSRARAFRPPRPEELVAPHGACVVGRLDGQPVTVGVVKRLGDGVAEIKRMYVAPEGRSRGIARVAARRARGRGAGPRLRAACGSTRAATSRTPRRSTSPAGYTEIADYNGNPFASFWAEKRL